MGGGAGGGLHFAASFACVRRGWRTDTAAGHESIECGDLAAAAFAAPGMG